MILDTFIPELAFSSALSNITLVNVADDVNFILSYKMSDGTYQEILSEPYTPDNDTNIYIIGLQKIIDGYLEESPVLDFKFRFEWGSNEIEYLSRIIKSSAELDTDARKFVSQRFLTVMKGGKTVYPRSLQYVSVYSFEPQSVEVTATYRNLVTGGYESASYAEGNTTANQITVIDVSPDKYMKEGKILVKYTVICDVRQIAHLVDNLSPTPSIEILFKNNFGVPETFCPIGNLSSERIFKNEYATIKGDYIKTNNSLDIEYISNTGIIDQYTAEWLESDLFSSYSTFLVKNKAIWKGITIIDQTVKRSSDKTEQPAYEFKYRLSQHNQEVKQFNKFLFRLFDRTFDNTFN